MILTLLVLPGAALADEVSKQEVNQAIDRGVKHLLAQQGADGAWTVAQYQRAYPAGPTALSLLALLKSGLAPDDPRLEKGFAFLGKQQIQRTYGAGLTLMAYNAWCEAKLKRQRFLRPGRGSVSTHRCLLPARHRRHMLSLAQALATSGKAGAWSYPLLQRGSVTALPERRGGPGQSPIATRADNSNTQYAVLGLRAAERCRIRIPSSVWHQVLDRFLETQQRAASGGPTISGGRAVPRGWAYQPAARGSIDRPQPRTAAEHGEPRMTMTCVGVACVLIAAEQLDRRRQLKPRRAVQIRESLRDGLAWIDRHYRSSMRERRDRKGGPVTDGYLLYGLERVGALARVELIGKHGWYPDGAALLIDSQGKTSGRFYGTRMYPGPVNTAFALLFLRRATLPVISR